jgi:hypothetical protein
MRRAATSDIEEALKKGVLSQHEAEKMQEADAAVSQAIAVDDFSRDDLVKGG